MITLIGSAFAMTPGSLPGAAGTVAASSAGVVLGLALLASLIILLTMVDHHK